MSINMSTLIYTEEFTSPMLSFNVRNTYDKENNILIIGKFIIFPHFKKCIYTCTSILIDFSSVNITESVCNDKLLIRLLIALVKM